jgi:hypothetical protein
MATNECLYCSNPKMKTKDECENCRRSVLTWAKRKESELVERIVLERVYSARKLAVAAERHVKLPGYEGAAYSSAKARRAPASHTRRAVYGRTHERRVS